MARLDYEQLEHALLVRLASVGHAAAPELARHLGISQPAFSRLVARCRQRLVMVGRGRATRYAARRHVPQVGAQLALYEVNETGGTRQVGTLHPILAEGFWVESTHDDLAGGFFDDLPYFLHELRPQGFLGRRIPARHPALELPADIQLWSADHCLMYLTRYGWDTVGNWLIGDRALNAYLEQIDSPSNPVTLEQREARYLQLCDDALGDAPGSSAGGEQPKFLATRVHPTQSAEPGTEQRAPTPVLVKFSPPVGDRVGRRFADLLIAEHVAHRVLNEHHVNAARSELLTIEDRIFLEVERFDRTPQGGRRGVLSLLALDAQFVGSARSWTQTAEALANLGHFDANIVQRIRWAECFGRLIANSDMHFGNLSLFTQGTRVLDVAPLYDMLPMLYAPQAGHLADRSFEPPPVVAIEAEVWSTASAAAIDYWQRLGDDSRLSDCFREICRDNQSSVERWQRVAQKSPWA